MGLLVQTNFETGQGVLITSVYLRICSITAQFRGTNTVVMIKYESHVNREKRLQGRQPLIVPNTPDFYTIETPLDSGWNSLPFLYSFVKSQLLSSGFELVEDVLETPEPIGTEGSTEPEGPTGETGPNE